MIQINGPAMLASRFLVFACLARAPAIRVPPKFKRQPCAHSSALGSDLEATVCVPFFPAKASTMNYDDDEHDDDDCFADTQEVSFLVVSG